MFVYTKNKQTALIQQNYTPKSAETRFAPSASRGSSLELKAASVQACYEGRYEFTHQQ